MVILFLFVANIFCFNFNPFVNKTGKSVRRNNKYETIPSWMCVFVTLFFPPPFGFRARNFRHARVGINITTTTKRDRFFLWNYGGNKKYWNTNRLRKRMSPLRCKPSNMLFGIVDQPISYSSPLPPISEQYDMND